MYIYILIVFLIWIFLWNVYTTFYEMIEGMSQLQLQLDPGSEESTCSRLCKKEIGNLIQEIDIISEKCNNVNNETNKLKENIEILNTE